MQAYDARRLPKVAEPENGRVYQVALYHTKVFVNVSEQRQIERRELYCSLGFILCFVSVGALILKKKRRG